ncbi:hypothetical protein MNB_SV-15-295 [hydrothermal vent metagenome]|uniref:Uncharacterized protein n=1 Tax=hydrothermal vent metagenome TaxID=652676 RepID=A0A1W1EIR5_9ZZZZ
MNYFDKIPNNKIIVISLITTSILFGAKSTIEKAKESGI